jgi:hypothetical protein
MPVALLGATLCGYLSWIVIEKRFLRRNPRYAAGPVLLGRLRLAEPAAFPAWRKNSAPYEGVESLRGSEASAASAALASGGTPARAEPESAPGTELA